MNWDFNNDLPIYSQLIRQIKYAVVSGGLKPGEKLQSVRDMALDAKVNPNTMQRALTELEREGILYAQRTSGRYVTDDIAMLEQIKKSLAQEQIEKFFEAMKLIGITETDAVKLIGSYKEEKNGNI